MDAPELLDAYLRYLEAARNLSPYTLRNYRTDLLHLFAFLEREGVAPLELDRQGFRRYLAHLHQAGTAPGSVARKVSTARSFYRFLVQQGHLEASPLAEVRPPKRPRRLPTYLPLEAVTSLIEAADGEGPQDLRDRALLELLYACGVRLSEVTRLDLADVDLAEGTARVKGKGGRERVVLIGEPARLALRRYLRQGRSRLSRDPGEAALFLNRDGRRLSGRSVQAIVHKYAERAGIDRRVWPHLLRHTFATHMLDGGADLRVVQELLGHATPTSTQIYMHVTQERQRQRYLDSFYRQVRLRSRQPD